MFCAGLVFLIFPRAIMGAYTTSSPVIATGIRLLSVAALFQLFDGLQVVATGVLRGAADTRTPMITNLIAHWLLGLPVGYFLCFVWDWGIVGLWVGLSLGLIAVGSFLLHAWRRRVRALLGATEQDLKATAQAANL